METSKTAVIGEVEDKIERAVRKTSRPRVTEEFARGFVDSIYKWGKKGERDAPTYSVDSRKRDSWMRDFVKEEPHLSGVLATSVSLDANRKYRLIGGRNQVLKMSARLKNVEYGKGWNRLKRLGAIDYYVTNMGQVIEEETIGDGALESLYHVDAARCRLTGDVDYPIEYTALGGTPMLWPAGSFYRTAGMYNPDESFYQLGYSPVNIAYKLAQIMVAIIDYDLEKLGHLAPRGLLLLESDSLSQDQINTATKETSQAYRESTQNEYYQNLMILVDSTLRGDLIELTKMPDNFDVFQFTDYMMKGYALAFGRDVRAFWSVNSGAFGGGKEAEMQAERATYAGQADYSTADQEQMRRLMPDTILFEYDFEDSQGDLLKAEVAKVWTEVGKNLIDIGYTKDEATRMLVTNNILDNTYLETEDETTSLQIERELALESEQVQRAVQRYQDEPIVSYESHSDKYQVLWEKGSQATKTQFMMPNWVGRSKRAVGDGRLLTAYNKALNAEDAGEYNKVLLQELLRAYLIGQYTDTIGMPTDLLIKYRTRTLVLDDIDETHREALTQLNIPINVNVDLGRQRKSTNLSRDEAALVIAKRIGSVHRYDEGVLVLKSNNKTCVFHGDVAHPVEQWKTMEGVRQLMSRCKCSLEQVNQDEEE